jgi:two-component system NtrC family response regulator
VKKPRVLVADDDPDQRRAVAEVLKGIAVIIEAVDGEDAVACAALERPDVVLLDQSMPGMSGFEALKWIREISPTSLVIMLTSESAIESARAALDAGASAYITKPFDVDFLRTEVARLLAPPSLPDDGTPWRTVV